LQRRYHLLVVSQLSSAQRLAAGVHAPPTLADSFATTQAAWRFYTNERVGLPDLCSPLIGHARQFVPTCCDQWTLTILDWSNLHYNGHASKTDRVELSGRNDLGYEMLTALAVSDRDGSPIAPLCVELRARDGLHTTRCSKVQKPASRLDRLEPVMDQVAAQRLGKPAAFIIDREADSVAHYRRWDAAGKKFLIRADDNRRALHAGRDRTLREAARALAPALKPTRKVLCKGKQVEQFVAETTVILNRPARQHRVDGQSQREKRKTIPGPAIALRLIVAEARSADGRVRARWLLLSNLPSEVSASEQALWYYWRWRIESYHKLLKSAGQQIEQWRQETAATLTRRLLVTAMTAVLAWQVARDRSPQGQKLRTTLVKLSGRQMSRRKNTRGFTESALLAGLCVLTPMLMLLEIMSVEELKQAAHEYMPLIRAATRARQGGSG
jgi:hypothetical protein